MSAPASALTVTTSAAPEQAPARLQRALDRFVGAMFRACLWGALITAVNGLVMTFVVDPTPRVAAIGVVAIAVSIAALRHSRATLHWLQQNPARLLALGLVVVATLAIADDGGWGGRYGPLVFIPIAIAAVAGFPRIAMLCALTALAALAFGTAAYPEQQDRWAEDPAAICLNAGLIIMATFVVVAPVTYLVRFAGRLGPTLTEIREEADVGALAGELPQLPGSADEQRARWEALTPAQQRVTLLLTTRSPKQIARDLSLSLATVRSHLADAKRRSGCRTLAELAALAATQEQERAS